MRIGAAINLSMVGALALTVWQAYEDSRPAREAHAREMRACGSTWGTLPTDLRCIFVKTAKHNPPHVLAAVAWQESRFNPVVCSKANACGLMQFMPGTALQYGVNVNDPHSSAVGGDRYLGELQRTYGNLGLALAAYNWGPGNLSRWLKTPGAKTSQMPQETREYVKAITGHGVEHWLPKRTRLADGGHIKRFAGEF